jgi:metal-responsive CopG/Arc/MetJ family transcriptional regulator
MEEKDKIFKRFTVSLPEYLYKEFEAFRKKKHMSRSDSIRKAMTSYMVSEKSVEDLTGDVIGCITMIMAHEHFDPKGVHPHKHDEKYINEHKHENEHEHSHVHNFQEGIDHDHDYSSRPIYANIQQTDLILSNDLQHHFGDVIISTMHIHIEFGKCLEIIAVSGPHHRVKNLYESLQRLRTVLSIGFFVVDMEESAKK